MTTLTTYKVTYYDKTDNWIDQEEYDTEKDAIDASQSIETGESAEVDIVKTTRIANVSRPEPKVRINYVK